MSNVAHPSHAHNGYMGVWVWEWECVGVEVSLLERLSRVSHASRFVPHDASDRQVRDPAVMMSLPGSGRSRRTTSTARHMASDMTDDVMASLHGM